MEISILIVTRKWKADSSTFNYINQLKHNNLDFEVLVAVGNNPSSQRNLMVQRAEGKYVLFLDDDSIPIVDLLEIYQSTILIFPQTKILGGPSILTNKSSFIYPLSKIFFSSAFGVGPVRSRYNSFGTTRKASEKDLILCNLLIEKDFFLKTKGFNQEIYPGEENEYLKSLPGNVEIIYNPNALVYREARATLILFLEQMYSYGNGRAKHFRLTSLFECFFLIPLAFTLYIFSLPFINVQLEVLYIPMIAHFFISVITLIQSKKEKLNIYQKLLLPFFFLCGHFCYGLGLLIGLLKYKILGFYFLKQKAKEQVEIHKLKNFKKYSN